MSLPDVLAIGFSVAAIVVSVASIRLNRKTQQRLARVPVRPWEQIRDCGCGLAPDYGERNRYGDPLPRGVVPCPVHARTGPPDVDD